MPSLHKHTLRRLARSTLNELQQTQRENASLVCARVQSPSGLALVPCALSRVDLSGQLRCWITQTWYRKSFYFHFWHPTHARTTRYEEAFLLEGKKRPRSLRSLGLALLLIYENQRAVGMLNSMRDETLRHVPGGRRDDTDLWPRLAQKIAEGKTSYELSWKIKVMSKKKK